MNFAKRVFGIAGIYGIAVVAPMYFLESIVGRDHPAGITHPEFFYGFICVTLACQFMFLVIARDPQRFRPLMLVSVWEKYSYVVACAILLLNRRIQPASAIFASIDFVLGTLFVAAWLRTAPARLERTLAKGASR